MRTDERTDGYDEESMCFYAAVQTLLKVGIPYCYWDEWQHVLLILGCGKVV